jgi:hypothetical protein
MENKTTKKQYLEKKYIEFSEIISKKLGINIFPSLEDVCMVDIIFYFNFTFHNVMEYRDILRILISHHIDISEELFQEIYPITVEYIEDLKNFLQTN